VGQPLRNVALASDIQVRARGGYAVAPPIRHATGAIYARTDSKRARVAAPTAGRGRGFESVGLVASRVPARSPRLQARARARRVERHARAHPMRGGLWAIAPVGDPRLVGATPCQSPPRRLGFGCLARATTITSKR
jgi:hypothetical protein